MKLKKIISKNIFLSNDIEGFYGNGVKEMYIKKHKHRKVIQYIYRSDWAQYFIKVCKLKNNRQHLNYNSQLNCIKSYWTGQNNETQKYNQI